MPDWHTHNFRRVIMSALNLNWSTLNLAAATVSDVNKEAGTATIEIEGVKLAVEFGVVEGGDRKGGCYITKFGHDCLVLCDGRRIQIGKGVGLHGTTGGDASMIAAGIASMIKAEIERESVTTKINVVISGLTDKPTRQLCWGAGIESYIFVSAEVGASVEFCGVEYSFSYQNGHSYKANNYNCPSNHFSVYQSNGFIEQVSRLSEESDNDDIQEIIERFDIDCTCDDVRKLYLALCDEMPTMSSLGLSDDTDDCLFFNDLGEEIEEFECKRLSSDLFSIIAKSDAE